jgi:hypothetical protein
VQFLRAGEISECRGVRYASHKRLVHLKMWVKNKIIKCSGMKPASNLEHKDGHTLANQLFGMCQPYNPPRMTFVFSVT